MSLPIYSGVRTTDAGVEVYVTRDGHRHHLSRLAGHSADGFDWGHGGSGPTDLARSIVGDYLGTNNPDDAYTRVVLSNLLSQAPGAGWTITPDQIHAAFRHAAPAFDSPVTLGRVVVTRPVDSQLMRDVTGESFVRLCLIRHERGDWGELDAHDAAANATARRNGGRLLSNYPIPPHVAADALKSADRLWVITEAADDAGRRLATTVLYPAGY